MIDDLAAGGGAIAELEGRPVGCLRWQVAPNGDLHVRRVAVEPQLQRRGIEPVEIGKVTIPAGLR